MTFDQEAGCRSRYQPRRDPRSNLSDSEWSMANIASDGARRWPDRLALVDGEARLTFEQLRARAAHLARALVARGVGAEDRVAVLGDRSLDTVVAILGIGMAGAAYVPLDPDQPAERLRFLLMDSDVQGLITTEALAATLSSAQNSCFFIELTGLASAGADDDEHDFVPGRPNPDAVAYIMYTSGSTGVPKGVQIEHRSVRVFFETHDERVAIEAGDRCLNTGPFHFDVSVMDVFLPLYKGATVFLGSRLPHPNAVLRAIESHRITHFYAVGTVLALITGDGSRLDKYDLGSLRILQTGAEVCNVRVVNEWLRRYPKLRFLNSYGPTEATVGCISYLKPTTGVIAEGACPIGLPHSSTDIALLSPDGTPLGETAEVGEIAIAGPQLMRGYWRRPAESALAFVWLDGERYYRTGDHAYRDELGAYWFVGRRDDEVKLRGHRLHLNEVLHCLRLDRRIEAALAGLIETGFETRELAVFIATAEPVTLELANAFEALATRSLPAATRPTRWAFTQRFPRLSSGKSDRDSCLEALTRAARNSDARYYVMNEEGIKPLSYPS